MAESIGCDICGAKITAIKREVIDITPPGAEWKEYRLGKKYHRCASHPFKPEEVFDWDDLIQADIEEMEAYING